MAALDRLESQDRFIGRRVFPAGFLQDYRNRTERLRALANHDVLLLVADASSRRPSASDV
jgi:hypothetical protein